MARIQVMRDVGFWPRLASANRYVEVNTTEPNETSPQSKLGAFIRIVFLRAQHQKKPAKIKRPMANVLNDDDMMMFAG